MEPVNLLLVGCGMMGARHVRGMAELQRVAPGSLRLAAVCDLRGELAQAVAEEAALLLGERPKVFANLQAAVEGMPDLHAADIVTDPRSHDSLAIELLQAGLHVLCEKPLALTVARGWRMVQAARRTGCVLATAENNRHDPINRLARTCIEAGLLGRPHFVLQLSLNPVFSIIGTAWRHRRAMGGVLVDVGIHQGYMLEYLLGPIESVSATAQLVATRRVGKQYDGTEVAVEVDVEDCFSALLQFSSGAQGHWTVDFASPGETMNRRLVLGAEGTCDLPPDRSGQPLRIRRGTDTLEGEALLAELPDWCLNDIEAQLFGERPASYSLPYPETDRKLIAAELASFVAAVRKGSAPESDAACGLRSVAVICAVLESATARRAVTVAEVLSGQLHTWQDTVENASV